jgi:hypothetical protein
MRPRIAFSRGATSKGGAKTRAHSESLRKIVRALSPFAPESLPFLVGKNPCGSCNPWFKKLKKTLAQRLRTQQNLSAIIPQNGKKC